MTNELWSMVPRREGHFKLESGYHTDVWLSLDALFTDTTAIAPFVEGLAARLRPYAVTGICGPFVGGAFLAQLLAQSMNLRFYYAVPAGESRSEGLFRAEYRLPPDLQRRIAGERLAIVDEMISAGSSVRASISAASTAGASVCVVGALVLLGGEAVRHFASIDMPVETLDRWPLTMWTGEACPLCAAGIPLETP